MDIIIIVFALMLLLSLRKSKEDFLSRKNCLSVREMMAFVIIFGHLAQRTGGKLFSLVSTCKTKVEKAYRGQTL